MRPRTREDRNAPDDSKQRVQNFRVNVPGGKGGGRSAHKHPWAKDDNFYSGPTAALQKPSRAYDTAKQLPCDPDDMEPSVPSVPPLMLCFRHEPLGMEGGGAGGGSFTPLYHCPTDKSFPAEDGDLGDFEVAFEKNVRDTPRKHEPRPRDPDTHGLTPTTKPRPTEVALTRCPLAPHHPTDETVLVEDLCDKWLAEELQQTVCIRDTHPCDPSDVETVPTMIPAQYECALTRSCPANLTLLRVLPWWSYVVLFTPILVPAGTLNTYVQDPTTDPFEPLGRAMRARGHNRSVGHMPYSLHYGFTKTHEDLVKQASAVVTVVCESDLNCSTTAPFDDVRLVVDNVLEEDLVEVDRVNENMEDDGRRCTRLDQQMHFANQVLEMQRDVRIADFGLRRGPRCTAPEPIRRKPVHVLLQCCAEEFRPAATAKFLNVVECTAYTEEVVDRIAETILPRHDHFY